jgi:hypothetical protein
MDINGSRIIRYFGSNAEINIPDTVEILDCSSFAMCDSICQILFGSNSKLRLMEEKVFAECRLLQSICIPSSVTTLGSHCFSECESLQISFCSNSQLRIISRAAFVRCPFPSIVVPSSVEVLGRASFDCCLWLVTCRFLADSKLTRIGDMAFHSCISLKSICLPSSVEYVGRSCFYGCNSVVDLAFSMPCRIRQLLDLPAPSTNGRFTSITIPDSVEELMVRTENVRQEYWLVFGLESKLARFTAEVKRSLLQFSARSLKRFRSLLEFGVGNPLAVEPADSDPE